MTGYVRVRISDEDLNHCSLDELAWRIVADEDLETLRESADYVADTRREWTVVRPTLPASGAVVMPLSARVRVVVA